MEMLECRGTIQSDHFVHSSILLKNVPPIDTSLSLFAGWHKTHKFERVQAQSSLCQLGHRSHFSFLWTLKINQSKQVFWHLYLYLSVSLILQLMKV